jgi:single-stranded-DNA-specific exonuclease
MPRVLLDPTDLCQAVGAAFIAALDGCDRTRPILIVGHFDADGLAAVATLARALGAARIDHAVRILGKGENPWDAAFADEVRARDPGGLIVTDLGVRSEPIASGVPTILIDHHVPTGEPGGETTAISGNGLVPEPTSALLAWWCAQALGDADAWLWLAALGLIGDMAPEDAFPELATAQARWGKTALRNAVSLINAPRRAAAADASPALALLMKAGGPKEVLSGAHPETQALLDAKAEVNAALAEAKRVPPRVQGDVALIRFASPCQIHPLIAQQWRGRLRDKIVLAANTGYRDGWVHFAARSASGRDLIAFLADHRPAGAGAHYGNGHVQATGGALRPAEWNAFVRDLGFPSEQVPA